jgi:DNA-binding NarL/FixJ family response regulator
MTETLTKTAPGPIRVLLVEDHPAYRAGLRAILGAAPDLEVFAYDCDSIGPALERIAVQEPDVILMDLHLADGDNGVEATRQIRELYPEVGILVLTMFDDADTVAAAVRAGARGYILKTATGDELIAAVRAVAAGYALFDPDIAEKLAESLSNSGKPPPSDNLTSREREVLALVADGLDNRQIARRLFISDKTVRNHVSALFSKLGVTSRAAAVAAARRMNPPL